MAITNIAVFVSGSGTNCENIIRYFSGSADVRVSLVVSNRSDAYALVRASRLHVPTAVVPKKEFNDPSVLLPLLEQYDVDFIVLAGFLLMVPDYLLERFPRRIVNIHPSLLPRHGGRGMWGHHVHESVKAAGDTETGITIHYVSEVCDGGEIIAQFKTPLQPSDTPDDIAAKVHVLEQEHFPKVIEQVLRKIVKNKVPL
jgi:phosphoribosylglycinamide formyltransferase-1